MATTQQQRKVVQIEKELSIEGIEVDQGTNGIDMATTGTIETIRAIKTRTEVEAAAIAGKT